MLKKIALALLIVCLLPVYALADPDPIIGAWYVDIEFSEGPKIAETENYIRAIMILTFEESGDISLSEIDYTPNNVEAVSAAICGKWERSGLVGYTTSIIGIGVNDAYIRDGVLYVIIADGVYYGFHRMDHFGWYTELIRK